MQNRPELKVFVYGTLKSGYQNHVRYCQGLIRVERAIVWGRLYDLGVGYPALQLPDTAILDHGTTNPVADVRIQAAQEMEHKSYMPLERPHGDWGEVHGEVLTFGFPPRQLEGMDRLEGFKPGQRSLYDRVLTVARWNGATSTVWAYVMPEVRGGKRILEGVWG